MIAFLIISWPNIEGARDLESNSKISDLFATPFIFLMSSSVTTLRPISPERMVMLVAIMTALIRDYQVNS